MFFSKFISLSFLAVLVGCGGGSDCVSASFSPPYSVLVDENNVITSYGAAYARPSSTALLEGEWYSDFWGSMKVSATGDYVIHYSVESFGPILSMGYEVRSEGKFTPVDSSNNLYSSTGLLIYAVPSGSTLPPLSPPNGGVGPAGLAYLSDSDCGKQNDLLIIPSFQIPTKWNGWRKIIGKAESE